MVQLIGSNTGFPQQSFMTFLDKNDQLNDTHQYKVYLLWTLNSTRLVNIFISYYWSFLYKKYAGLCYVLSSYMWYCFKQKNHLSLFWKGDKVSIKSLHIYNWYINQSDLWVFTWINGLFNSETHFQKLTNGLPIAKCIDRCSKFYLHPSDSKNLYWIDNRKGRLSQFWLKIIIFYDVS